MSTAFSIIFLARPEIGRKSSENAPEIAPKWEGGEPLRRGGWGENTNTSPSHHPVILAQLLCLVHTDQRQHSRRPWVCLRPCKQRGKATSNKWPGAGGNPAQAGRHGVLAAYPRGLHPLSGGFSHRSGGRGNGRPQPHTRFSVAFAWYGGGMGAEWGSGAGFSPTPRPAFRGSPRRNSLPRTC